MDTTSVPYRSFTGSNFSLLGAVETRGVMALDELDTVEVVAATTL